jgi:NAD(P)-dependent dehydrogenase (short-subunit alcohol dehydrogenase family)
MPFGMSVKDATGSSPADPATPGAGAPRPLGPGRVAVVTGAASGIGLALAERFAAEGMNVVMADAEEPALSNAAAQVADSLAGEGASALPVVTDVSDRAAVDALRDAALSAFGAVHVVCNNAGVGGPHGPLWECPPGEWDWVLGVNLEGVMNGVRAFMPVLLEQDAAHLVNTSSGFGVFAGSLGPYAVSKHAVTALTETLHFNLKTLGVSQVGLSVLCPSAVKTNFGASARNRPAWAGPTVMNEAERATAEQFNELSALGASPAEVAAMVLDGIRSRRFYLLTSANRAESILRRAREIVDGGPPEPPVPFV